MRGQVQENKPGDKPDTGEAEKKEGSDAVDSWNEWAAQRPEKGLSPEERTERQKIERFPDTIGRRFNELPTVQDVRAYYDQLSQAVKDALNNPDTKVTLECYASHTGDADYNKELTRKSGEAARRILQKEFGVKADITIKAHGYDQDLPEGDDSFDRQVQVNIQSGKGEKYPEKQTTKEGNAGQEQGLKKEDEIGEPITDAIQRGLKGIQNILFPGAERPGDKGEQLPETRRNFKQEMAERKKVEARDGAIARAFGKPPTEQNIREWYNQLTPEEKNLLRNPDSKITLFASTSRPGSFEANKELAEKSLEVTQHILEKEYGVKAKIYTGWGIPAEDAAPGGDDRFLRHVQVIIEKPKT